jgi:hypothetical protein
LGRDTVGRRTSPWSHSCSLLADESIENPVEFQLVQRVADETEIDAAIETDREFLSELKDDAVRACAVIVAKEAATLCELLLRYKILVQKLITESNMLPMAGYMGEKNLPRRPRG